MCCRLLRLRASRGFHVFYAFSLPQAVAMWQWYNFYAHRVVRGKQVLKINMDETSVHCYEGTASGAVFTDTGKRARPVEQHLPNRKRRKFLTHVAFICDRADIQNVLPQVVIGNEAAFLQRDMARLRGACPANVILIRRGVCPIVWVCFFLHASACK